MRHDETSPDNLIFGTSPVNLVLGFVAGFLLGALIPSCTVTPVTVKDSGASYDANVRNSGFIGYAADGSGIITPSAKLRYDDLCRRYGDWFHPPIMEGFGLFPTATNTYLLTSEALVNFGVMQAWERSDLHHRKK